MESRKLLTTMTDLRAIIRPWWSANQLCKRGIVLKEEIDHWEEYELYVDKMWFTATLQDFTGDGCE